MDGRLVGADDDPPAANLLQLADGDLGVGGQASAAASRTPAAAVPPRSGRRCGRPIEQPVAELFLEAPDRLADGRLRPVQLLGGHREAALGGNGDKRAQILQLHGMNYNLELFKSNKYKLDSRLEPEVTNVTGASNHDDHQPPDDLRHDAARRRTGPRLLAAHRREAEDGAAAVDARRRHHRGRVSDRLGGRRRGGAAGLDPRPGSGHCRAGALSSGRHRPRRLGADAGAAPPHPHVHRHLRPAPRAQAAHVAGDLPRGRRRRDQAGAAVHRRRAVFGRGCDAQRHGVPVPGRRSGHRGRVHHGQSAGYRRLCRPARDQRRSSRPF